LQSWLRGIPVVTMFDPDSVVQREGLGSAHSTVADMVAGLGRLLQSRKAYSAASAATREFMRDRFGDDRVLAPYLLAFDESEVRMTGGLPAVNAPITGVDTAADGRRR
jgi:hypothetical protein